jgi:hypothetical protein
MARVVCVHGIGQQGKGRGRAEPNRRVRGERALVQQWRPALEEGLSLSGAGRAVLPGLSVSDVACVFYADVFLPPESALSAIGEPWLTAEDATEEDAELLLAWWEAAALVDPGVVGPDERTLLRTPRAVQAGLNALSGSRFFAGLADRALLFDLAQVRRYLGEVEVRAQVQARVGEAVGPDTRVVVGHSLGSVVAYEALAAHPQWPVTTLVTLGSPLGIRNLIFDRLRPAPEPFPVGGVAPGRWPGRVRRWVNIADTGDVVALVKSLGSLFGMPPAAPHVVDGIVDNGCHAHAVTGYLAAEQTGTAIAAGLG